MNELPLIDDYRSLLRTGTPLLDVRAPVEFHKGAFPQAINLPLLNNEERHLVGIHYKHQGHDAAVQLGQKLLKNGDVNKRLANWKDFVAQHPDGALYCFRGGQRSCIVQKWIYAMTGVQYPRIKGGYKELRHFLIEILETLPDQLKPIVLGGRTGVGKTLLLRQWHQAIDLEGLARHRGSAFGALPQPQPTQINFENTLAIELIRHKDRGQGHLLFEDESRNIGSLHLGAALYKRLCHAPLVVLEASLEQRVNTIFNEYVTQALASFQRAKGSEEAGFDTWKNYVFSSFARIKRRLGGKRYYILHANIEAAMKHHQTHRDATAHRDWIIELLHNYYDPMYDYQLAKKNQRQIFNGDALAINAYFRQLLDPAHEAIH